MAYIFLGFYILLLMFCYVAGSPSITRVNEQIGEGD